MKKWTPRLIYGAKPWVMIVCGTALGVGGFALSVFHGDWSGLRGLSCAAGAALAIGGGAILQMRLTYRAQSKWRRERTH